MDSEAVLSYVKEYKQLSIHLVALWYNPLIVVIVCCIHTVLEVGVYVCNLYFPDSFHLYFINLLL